MPPFFAAARRNQKAKAKSKNQSKTHAQPKGNAKEKFNFTNHSRVITWKMNFFLSSSCVARHPNPADLSCADGKVPPHQLVQLLPALAPPSPFCWQTNNSQFVRFNFCVCFVKFFNFTFVINQTRAPNWLKVNAQPCVLAGSD